MPFGLPGRTTTATAEVKGTDRRGNACSQFLSTRPALTMRVMSGATDMFTTSAGTCRATLRD